MMTFIRDMNKPLTKKERAASFEAVKEEFGQLQSQPAHSVFELFDIMSWIESKVSGKPFSQVVKERFQKETGKAG
jgi:CubicO group peptidase (beta-lactamase class C family)